METVDGKRLKCNRSLRHSIFCGVSSLLLFLPGWGEGGRGGGMSIQKKAAEQSVLSSLFSLVKIDL